MKKSQQLENSNGTGLNLKNGDQNKATVNRSCSVGRKEGLAGNQTSIRLHTMETMKKVFALSQDSLVPLFFVFAHFPMTNEKRSVKVESSFLSF